MREHTFRRLFIPAIFFALIPAILFVTPVHADDEPPTGATIQEGQPVESNNDLTTSSDATISRDSVTTTDGDPYFTVGTTTYHFYKTISSVDCSLDPDHCFKVDTPISDALEYMTDHNLTPSDRKLYIDEDTYNEYVEIDGKANGVKGLTGLVGEDKTSADVLINGEIYVHDMASGFSFSNLVVVNNDNVDEAAIWAENNSGAITLTDVKVQATKEDSSGLVILNQKGSIILNRVDSSNNAYKGLDITYLSDNPAVTTSVSILNSSFDNNLNDVKDGSYYYEYFDDGGTTNYYAVGASVNIVLQNGKAPVTMNGVSASGSKGDGADIYADYSIVTIKNSVFDNNQQDYIDGSMGNGLYIISAISNLENINSNGNYLSGVYDYSATSFTGVHLNSFNNGGTGIQVVACNGNPCVNTGAGTVTIRNSSAAWNGANGIDIAAKGAVVLYDVYGGSNTGTDQYGILINNQYTPTISPVTLTLVIASNNFNGIAVYSKGAVTVTNMTANENSHAGILIDNSSGVGAPVTFTISSRDVFTFNQARQNGNGNGLTILSRGAVTLTSFEGANNNGDGINIDNSTALSPMPVTIKVLDPNNTSSYNGSNTGGGLTIRSHGIVTVSSMSVNDNEDYGLSINNRLATDVPGPAVVLSSIDASNNCIHDGDGNCVYSDNGIYGIWVQSDGAITVKNVTAYQNDGNGMNLNNQYGTVTGAVTIGVLSSGWNEFSNNHEYGLSVYSNGAVSLTYIKTENNLSYGTYVASDGNSSTVPVTVLHGYFNNNCAKNDSGCYDDGNSNHFGLRIDAIGVISITDITATNNYSYGVSLNNSYMNTNALVNVNSVSGSGNSFLDNQDTGLRIRSNGAITVNNVTSNYSKNGYGLDIKNSNGTAAITLKQSGGWSDYYGSWWQGNTFNGNEVGGVLIDTNGAVTIAFYQIRDNRSYGLLVEENDTACATVVTVNGLAMDYSDNVAGNDDGGILIGASGNITLNYIQARNNKGSGANLENYYGLGGITINNGYFEQNYAGLDIHSNGAVIWKNGRAGDNYYEGVYINNIYSIPSVKPVTITNVDIWGNGYSGLFIVARGAVLLTNVQSNNNSADWFGLDMNDLWTDNMNEDQTWVFEAPASGNVSINLSTENFIPSLAVYDLNGELIDNLDGTDYSVSLNLTGLTEDETYLIKVKSNEWNGESYSISIFDTDNAPVTFTDRTIPAFGIYIDNGTGLNASVTLINSSSRWDSNNSGTDVYINSSGAVSVTNVSLNDSGNDGLWVDNRNAANAAGVTLKDIDASNNEGNGVLIASKGAITIKSLNADGNDEDGYSLRNNYDVIPSPIVISSNYIGNNGKTGGYIETNGTVALFDIYSARNYGGPGIEVRADGAVTFTNVGASYNGGYGAYVSTLSTFTMAASSSGYNRFGQNTGDGLYVDAGGKVTLNKVQSWGNGRDESNNYIDDANGIIIISRDANGLSPVLITNVLLDNNTMDGLKIDTYGAVTANNLISRNNGNMGLIIDQTDALGSQFPINLSNLETSGNGNQGMQIWSKGNITLSKFVANFNQKGGAELDNSYGTGTLTILNPTGGTVMNNVVANGDFGVIIASNGAISITGLEVSGNSTSGLWIRNSTMDISSPAVTLTKVISRFNNEYGIYIESDGVVTINDSWANSNSSTGIYVVTSSNMFMTNTGSISNNWAGIHAELGTGKLTLKNCTWFGNLRDGSYSGKNLEYAGTPLIL